MKFKPYKLIAFLIFLNAVFLINSNIVLSSDDIPPCAPGYTRYVTGGSFDYDDGTNISNCRIIVYYCCKWDNDLKRVISEIFSYHKDYRQKYCDIEPFAENSNFLIWLHDIVGKAADKSCAPSYPPCDDPNQNYFENVVTSSSCWMYENWQPFQGDDYVLRTVACKNYSVNCVTTTRVCIDYSDPLNPVTKRQFISRETIGIAPGCSTTKPILPPLGDPLWETHWATSCFYKPC